MTRARPRGLSGSSWGTQWHALLGLPVSRTGRVTEVSVTADGMKANVRTEASGIQVAKVTLPHLPPHVFEAALRTLAGKARFGAALLSGRVPAGLEAAFESAGGRLFPEDRSELSHSCTCEEAEPVCSHLAATHALLAERLDRDPFTLFVLRGMERDDVLRHLRAHRSAGHGRRRRSQSEGPIPLPALRVVSREPLPDVRPEAFFKPGRPVASLKSAFHPTDVPEAILTRLGPAPLSDPDAVQLLLDLHRAIGLGAKERLSEWEWQRVLSGGRNKPERR
jgi:uncharacterized Zn finger protein